MRCTRVDHIALLVESIRQAENLYTRLFDMRVRFRDAAIDGAPRRIAADAGASPDGDGRAPSGDDQWAALKNVGAVIHRSCLEGEGLRLMLLRRTDGLDPHGRLDHVCLCADPEDLPRLERLASELGCRIAESEAGYLVLVDPYGISWTVSADGERT